MSPARISTNHRDGRLREAVETGNEAVRLLEQACDLWEANVARMIGTMAVYHLGDLQRSLENAKRAYEIGCETGDYSAMAIAMWLWVRIHPASVPTASIKTEFERARTDPLTAAKRAVRNALRISKSYLNDRPHALRECALVAVLEGHEAKSRRYFDESLRVAQEQQARYEKAKTLLARAEAGLQFGWAEAEQEMTEARGELKEIEGPLGQAR